MTIRERVEGQRREGQRWEELRRREEEGRRVVWGVEMERRVAAMEAQVEVLGVRLGRVEERLG